PRQDVGGIDPCRSCQLSAGQMKAREEACVAVCGADGSAERFSFGTAGGLEAVAPDHAPRRFHGAPRVGIDLRFFNALGVDRHTRRPIRGCIHPPDRLPERVFVRDDIPAEGFPRPEQVRDRSGVEGSLMLDGSLLEPRIAAHGYGRVPPSALTLQLRQTYPLCHVYPLL